MFFHRVGNLYAWVFGWPALQRIHKSLFYLSSRALGLGNYSSPQLSGEVKAAKKALGTLVKPVIFDVGANSGDWLDAVLRLNANAEIHAFEPQADLAKRIKSQYPGVHVNAVAVGDAIAESQLQDYAHGPGSQHASLVAGVIESIHGGLARSVLVHVTTLDEYCKQRKIDRIDFLKIDVEGYELQVLKGGSAILGTGAVGAIQFEFNEMNVLGSTHLRDFFELLGNRYDFYRILPHGLMAMNPRGVWFNEQYVFQNIIAIRKQ